MRKNAEKWRKMATVDVLLADWTLEGIFWTSILHQLAQLLFYGKRVTI